MQNDNVVFLRKCDQFFIKRIRCCHTDRIQRIGHNHHLCPSCLFFRNLVEFNQEIVLRMQVIGFHLCTTKERACCKNRITRIRHKHYISRVTNRHGNMRHSLLGTINRHNFFMTNALNTIALCIMIADCIQQFRQISQCVFVILRL